MRILIVEDDPLIAGLIQRVLSAQSYAVDHAGDGETGLEMASVNDYDVVVLDLLLPKRTGIEVCRELRQEGSIVPILMLTSLDHDEDVIKGLDAGADDYLGKPFNLDVFLARVRALARRDSKQKTAELRLGDLVLDSAGRTVTRAGMPVGLTAKELNLLEYFMLNPNEVLTREMISEHVWDMNFDPQSNVVESLVRRVRKKIGKTDPTIHTVRGAGYRLGDTP
ncbi:MAG TPA: response regulator transcription factor [Candidatus Kapabacteria bacterium]|jgi:two-component system copper resistance phosphate regulon response regulator CusR|nr:response regulator transcription factor [Candidatus Kapabacteria bacterium]